MHDWIWDLCHFPLHKVRIICFDMKVQLFVIMTFTCVNCGVWEQKEFTMLTSGSPKSMVHNQGHPGSLHCCFFSFPFSLQLRFDTLRIQLWSLNLYENIWEEKMKLRDLLPLCINNTMICRQDEAWDLYLHIMHWNTHTHIEKILRSAVYQIFYLIWPAC